MTRYGVVNGRTYKLRPIREWNPSLPENPLSAYRKRLCRRCFGLHLVKR